MKELKTLKDMEHYNSWEGFKGHIEERELKAEAVKRFLYFTNKMNKRDFKTQIWYYYKGKCDELVENFNLTEDDLKETEDEK